jgi:hypothetical protein
MAYVFGTFIVTQGVRTALRDLSTHLDHFETDGMYVTGLSATGIAPATHFISSGMVPLKYAQCMANPTKMFTDASAAYAADQVAFPYTQLQVTNNLALCDVSQDNPFAAMARMGLQMVR